MIRLYTCGMLVAVSFFAQAKETANGFFYSYTTEFSGDDSKKTVNAKCEAAAFKDFDSWKTNKQHDLKKKGYTCIEPAKDSTGKYFAQNHGCNRSFDMGGRTISSTAEAIRTPGAKIEMWMGRWFLTQKDCDEAKGREEP